MRSKFGYTNSPTLVAFRGIYRKILAGIDNIFVAMKNENMILPTSLTTYGWIAKKVEVSALTLAR